MIKMVNNLLRNMKEMVQYEIEFVTGLSFVVVIGMGTAIIYC